MLRRARDEKTHPKLIEAFSHLLFAHIVTGSYLRISSRGWAWNYRKGTCTRHFQLTRMELPVDKLVNPEMTTLLFNYSNIQTSESPLIS